LIDAARKLPTSASTLMSDIVCFPSLVDLHPCTT
jgi:hypothetical protein